MLIFQVIIFKQLFLFICCISDSSTNKAIELNIPKTVVTLSLSLLIVQQWNFLEDLQDSSEFYPDGLAKCPPETYTVHEDESGRIKCFACPVCPPGKEPSAPCGITLDTKPAGECIPCKPGTYSDKVDSRSCKICSDCESRNIISSCTTEKNTECQDCPKRHYEDEKTHGCKPCSGCCPKSYAAQIECLISKKCRESCARSTKTRKYLNKKIARSTNAMNNEALTKEPTMSLKQSRMKNMSQFDQLDSNDKNVSLTIVKRDLEAEVESKSDQSLKNRDSQTRKNSYWDELEEELDFLRIPPIKNIKEEEVEQPITDQSKNSNHLLTPKRRFNGTKIRAIELEEQVSSQASLGKNYITFQTTETTLKEVTELGEVTPHDDAAQNEFLNSALGSFAGTILAAVFLVLMGLLVYTLCKKCVCKILQDPKELKRTSSDSTEPQSTGKKNNGSEHNILIATKSIPLSIEIYVKLRKLQLCHAVVISFLVSFIS